RELSDALPRQRLDLRENLSRSPRDLAAAHGRDYAVGAHRVAPHRDLHPGLEASFPVLGKAAREGAFLRNPEGAALDADPSRAEPFAEVRNGARPEGDIDERVTREEPLALSLRVAPA